ncbi:hypothetical protein [Sphingomonas sp.]|jgi:hypothetical protein|uniref:hypothetical protein n=1 Tax=Sphingomonas sp. TaxID=28214 RepID=UPI002D80E7CC|nr:hypothetical protein [Sphingomonas sp.]HEU0044749.1 hypothetical protein [Sphingomonas sp.]
MKLLAMFAALAAPLQAQRPCLTASEAEALAAVALPDILRQTGVTCAARLPATSLLRRPQSPLLGRYEAEAERAWPAARAALGKLVDPAAQALLGSDFARPVLTTMVTPLIVGRIAVKDCGTIDRLVTLLEPLPPRNTAGVVVATVRHLQKQPANAKGPVGALPLCP